MAWLESGEEARLKQGGGNVLACLGENRNEFLPLARSLKKAS